ncbi:MAG: hypothetical protein ACLGI9_26560 [Thermoanaerobaculia bacterium]
MSQRKRIVLVAAVLVAAFAVVPAPSQAAGFRGEGLSVLDVWERARVWGARRIGWGEVWRKEGSAINPDGSPKPGSAAPAPNTATAEEEPRIDPSGAK